MPLGQEREEKGSRRSGICFLAGPGASLRGRLWQSHSGVPVLSVLSLAQGCQLAPKHLPIKGLCAHSALEAEAVSWWSVAAPKIIFLIHSLRLYTAEHLMLFNMHHTHLKGFLTKIPGFQPQDSDLVGPGNLHF